MDSAILNLARMDRVKRYLRPTMDEGTSYRLAQPSYSYMEIPLRGFLDGKSGELIQEVKANQTVRVQPAGIISLSGPHCVLVQVNSKLLEMSTAPGTFLIAPNEPEGSDISFVATFRKAVEAKDIPWAVRLFLLA